MSALQDGGMTSVVFLSHAVEGLPLVCNVHDGTFCKIIQDFWDLEILVALQFIGL